MFLVFLLFTQIDRLTEEMKKIKTSKYAFQRHRQEPRKHL